MDKTKAAELAKLKSEEIQIKKKILQRVEKTVKLEKIKLKRILQKKKEFL